MSVRIAAGGLWFVAQGEPVTVRRHPVTPQIVIGNIDEEPIVLYVNPSDLPRWREAIDRAIQEAANGPD